MITCTEKLKKKKITKVCTKFINENVMKMYNELIISAPYTQWNF